MNGFKKLMKTIGKQLWEFCKSAFPSWLMYDCAGCVLMILTFQGDKLIWDGTSILWTCVCVVAAAAYNGMLAFAQGGSGYEMLVSGNVIRRSANEYGDGYRISKHREEKEYRAWKGFAVGGVIALFPLVFGLIAGGTYGNASIAGSGEGGGTFFLLSAFLSGWSLMPFYLMNAEGMAISYYWSCLFALVPVLASGALYIVGAYARRNKEVRKQRIADAQAAAEANKVKKINYGGLPGTKPRKRK